jgi:hypothetical protein
MLRSAPVLQAVLFFAVPPFVISQKFWFMGKSCNQTTLIKLVSMVTLKLFSSIASKRIQHFLPRP